MPRTPDFDALYRADRDPWAVATSWYEQRKQQVVLASLTASRYARAWDAACGTGALVVALAERCDDVLATDGSGAAVEITSHACRSSANVAVRQVRLPQDAAAVPPAAFDLVILGEFLYYLDESARHETLQVAASSCAPRSEIVVTHWRHRSEDAWLSGADVNAEAVDLIGWPSAVHHDDSDFVLDILVRADA